MSVLAMILVAGMAVGDGPERVSGEVERGLDLSGEWEGTFREKGKEAARAWLKRGVLIVEVKRRATIPVQFADDGHGMFRMRMRGKPPWSPGDYEMGDGSVVLTFRAGPIRDNEIVIALKRVKPAK
jgi:hypothetical protein